MNEARLSLSLDDVYSISNQTEAGFHRDLFGINYPYIFPKEESGKIPNLNMPNFYSLSGGSYPSHSSGPIWVGSDSMSKVSGNHMFKFGGSFEYSGENDTDYGYANPNGIFTFTDTRTGLGATSGVGMANLALGLADSYIEEGPRSEDVWRGWNVGAIRAGFLENHSEAAYRLRRSLQFHPGVPHIMGKRLLL